ncbi:hypothetical protein [Desertivirga xinjiangensis]|uniref:hypothetical protein n=1 Tax=Desertivirga xinjiangensis TaxID=539206 RepID=UPI00210B0A23|nr:hypothetical protein [Pedobacter xinjiangensis]
MKTLKYIFFASVILSMTACDKKNDNLIAPIVENDFPQILLLADEGDGELEDEDKFSFKITLADRKDPEGNELGGKIIPLEQDATVNFEVSDTKGFDAISSYILDAKAFYEIDDCTSSEDADIDLNMVFDARTGKGSVTFPKGVEEIEIEFETEASLFDDDVFNEEERGLEIKLSSVNAPGQNVVVNSSNVFEYRVLDDEGIYGEYELDIDDASQFQNYINLFGLVNEEVKGLSADDVEEIKIEFQYGELKALVVLKQTIQVSECGETETVNREIEIEADLEELEGDSLKGDLELVGEIEDDKGASKEFVYKGSFEVVSGALTLVLQGEFDDDETEEITLALSK